MSLLVEELFDYTAQNLNGLNGGSGWTGAWSTGGVGAEQARVVANNLSYAGMSNGSPSNNSKFLVNNEGDGSANRLFSRSYNGIPNTVNGAVYWLAFGIASNLSKGGATFWLNKLTSDSAGASPQVLLQWTSSLVDAQVNCHGTLLYTGSGSYVAHNIVFKLTMSGAALTPIRVDVYCDVDMTTDSSGWTPKVTNSTWYVTANITTIQWNSNTTASSSGDDFYYMDNLRWATTSYEAGGNTAPAAYNSRFFLLF